MSLKIVRINLHHFAQKLNRSFRMVHCKLSPAESKQCLGIARVRLERCLEKPLCLNRPTLIQQNLAEIAVGSWIFGKAPKFRPELLLREFRVTLPKIEIAKSGMYTHEIWICFLRLLVFLNRIGPLLHLVIGGTHHDVSS